MISEVPSNPQLTLMKYLFVKIFQIYSLDLNFMARSLLNKTCNVVFLKVIGKKLSLVRL